MLERQASFGNAFLLASESVAIAAFLLTDGRPSRNFALGSSGILNPTPRNGKEMKMQKAAKRLRD